MGRLKKAAGGKFVKDTFVLQFGMAVTMATYMFTSVLLARGLGPEDFGRYTLAFSLYSLVFFIANVGITTATVSGYSKAVGRGDDDEKVRSLAAFLKAFVVMSVVVLLAGSLLPVVVEHIYDDREVGLAAWLLCLLGPCQMLNGFILVILQGARRMKDYVLYDNSCGVLRLLILLFAVMADLDLLHVVMAYLVSALISSAVGLRMYTLVRRDAARHDAPPALRDVLRAVPGARLKSVLSTGTLIAVTKNLGEVMRNLTNSGIGKVVGAVELAHFRVAFIYMWALQQLLGGLGRNLLPSMGVRLERHSGSLHKFSVDLMKVALVSGTLFIGMTALFCLAAPWVIGFLYGREYQDSVHLVFLLAVGHLFLGFHVVIDIFYIYTKQLLLSVKINLAMAFLILLPVGYVLISRYGVVGGAIFLSFGQFVPVVHFLVIWRFMRRHGDLAGPPGGPREVGSDDNGDDALPIPPAPE